MDRHKMAAECKDFEEFYWPARCRGYLEGKRASDCIANLELARLRERNTELGAALRKAQWTGRIGHPRLWCPVCHNWKREGHAPDCPIAAALKGD